MAKAYDRDNWSFLSQVLNGFGLTGKSHDIIMACVTSATFSVLVNGSPQGHFAAERGLRQGCPLSPFLFILCSEILSQITYDAERRDLYKGLQINRWAPAISHLLFADDLFFFGTATIENVLGVKHILKQYEEYSGQLVNYEKSSLYTSPHLDPSMLQILLDILGVVRMAPTDKYLGRQLLLPSSRIASFNSLLDRCKKKLATWKAKSLSHAGRMILLKSSLASIPIYTMGTTLLPKGVTNKLAQLQRKFWWGGTQEERKLCLIAWSKFMAPKHEGGLGFRNPELVNISLVSKLVKRFLSDGNALWCKLLRSKYLRNKSFWDVHKTSSASHIWSGMLECRDRMRTGCCWFVGSNSSINIWQEPWVPLIPGFRVEGKEGTRQRVALVKELMIPNSQQWNNQLIFQLFDPHEANAICEIHIRAADDEKMMWLPMATGIFSAKSMYRQLVLQQPSGSNLISSLNQFNWNKLWTTKGTSPRTVLFLWRALQGGIAVATTLGRLLHSNESCKVCHSTAETIDHALLHCSKARATWMASGIPLPYNFDHMNLHQVFGSLCAEGEPDHFRLALAILWIIWKARNDVVFNNKSSHTEVMLQQAQVMFQSYKNPPTDHISMESFDTQGNNHNYLGSHWSPPPLGFIKINVDGACLEGRSAAGAIARDHLGGFVGCTAKELEFGTPILAEANAFLLGIQLIQNQNLSNVIIEGDSKLMVEWINNPGRICDWRAYQAVQLCREFLSQRSDISCQFSPRETNAVAHALAHFSITYHVTNTWSEGLPPPPLLDPIFADLAFIVNPS